jgi:type II secretory pathway component PulK
MLVIAITSGLTFYLGSSVYFSARIHSSFIQRVQAEFLLKSALNVARLLASQSNGSADPPRNTWGPLVQGIELPGELLGVDQPNVIVGLEMTSLDSKLSLRNLYDSSKWGKGTPGHDLFLKWRDSFARLFQSLGFDNDNEVVTQGPTKGTFFNSQQLVANLIDYMDGDEESYRGEGSFANGIESSLPKGTFANKQEIFLGELESIPGFTANRIKKLWPYVTTVPVDTANINLISTKVLMAIAPELNEASAAQIIAYARGPDGPYETFDMASLLSPYFNDFNEVSKMLTTRSSHLQVLSKVQYGSSRYFLRATIEKSNVGVPGQEPDLPEVTKLELFG